MQSILYPVLEKYIQSCLNELGQIPDQRKQLLNSISEYVRDNDQSQLTFICTHNSRRSHLGQIWAKVAAHYFNIDLETFSGGTEATAFHPNAIASLKRAGFNIKESSDTNPKVEVNFSLEEHPLICFSKKYDDPPNPTANFAAIMTCSEANAECPVVVGATKRIKLLYEDPKVSDGSPMESQTYDDRCRQIAREMLFVFSQINSQS
jgi:arsenate reductase